MSRPDTEATPRSRSRRTPPTIELTAREDAPAPGEAAARADVAPEAILPTEALPQEFPGAPAGGPIFANDMPERAAEEPMRKTPAAGPLPPAPARIHWPSLTLAGLVGGVVGAGLVLLAFSRAGSGVAEAQMAELRGRVEGLQAATAALPNRAALQAVDAKAAAAAESAAKAGADARAATARLGELANAPAAAGNASAIIGLNERLGSVETLAKSAAAPSSQALAAARIVLAERVQLALASGQPFAADVAALAKGGGAPDQIAALNAVAASGAASRDALLGELRGHRGLFERAVTPVSAGWQDRLLGLASRLVTVRAVGDSGANDPATLPARLESALSRGAIGAAAGLWAQLPEPARRDSAAFGAALQKRAAADAAIAQIARDAVAALGAAG